MSDEELLARVARIERTLSATRFIVKIAVMMAILGWIGCGVLGIYFTITVPSHLVVKDSMGNTAVLDANGLRFNSPNGVPAAWFAAWPEPVLAMSVDGVPYVKLQVTPFEDQTLGKPFGTLWLSARNGQARTIKPSP
jgi:hypothetical protein